MTEVVHDEKPNHELACVTLLQWALDFIGGD